MVRKAKWPLYLGGALLTGLLSFSDIRDSTVGQPKTNREYVLAAARNDESLAGFFEGNNAYLAEKICKRLHELDHINPEGYEKIWGLEEVWVMNKPAVSELMVLDTLPLIRTYYLLEALRRPDFRNQLGLELELDTEDYTGEHGGYLHLESSATVEVVPNENESNMALDFHDYNPDGTYTPGRPKKTLDILFPFHFHAREADYSGHSALSSQDFFWGSGAVFTRTGENEFNADVGLFTSKDGRRIPVNIDLGIYKYEKE